MAGRTWTRMPLGDFVTLQRGHDLPEVVRRPGNKPVLGSFGVTGWHDEARSAGPGVTVGRSGASLGVVSYSPVDYWPLNTALYVTDFHGNDQLFAYYFLKQFDFRVYNSGSAQPSLNRNFIHPVPVDVPPLSEQRAIAHILGTLDDKIELNRRMNATLEAMARALFKDWFVDFGPTRTKIEGRDPYLAPEIWDLFPDRLGDDGKPEGWEEKPLSRFFSILGGGTPKTKEADYWGGDIFWYSVVDAPNSSGLYVFDTEKKITQRGLNESSAKLVREGTTIISARGTVGTLAMAAQDMTFNQSCYGLQGTGNVGDCLTYLATKHMVSRLQAMAHGSVFSTITASTFESLMLQKPDGDIFPTFDKAVSPLFSKIKANGEESRTLVQSRDLLLPKLMSGEIRVSDADKIVQEST